MQIDGLSKRERSVLRRARHSAAWPRGWALVGFVLVASVVGWSASNAVKLWDVDRAAAWAALSHTLWFVAILFLATELDAAFRLLARFAPAQEESFPGAAVAAGASARALAAPEVRRLVRAPAYAEQLERLRWLVPILASGAVGSAVAALAWAEIPRPLDLIVAAMAGVSIAAVVAVSALRGWVRLTVALSQRGGGATG